MEPTIPDGGGDFGPICGLLRLGIVHGAIQKLFELVLEGIHKLVVVDVPDCASLVLQNFDFRGIMVLFRVVSDEIGF